MNIHPLQSFLDRGKFIFLFSPGAYSEGPRILGGVFTVLYNVDMGDDLLGYSTHINN